MAAGLTATVLVALLALSFGGHPKGVDVTLFAVAFVLILLCGIVLASRGRTRRVGFGILIGVAIALLATNLASFLWLGWLANELGDS